MAKRKQKRRRQKERRHEWEYVYVDDEGNEVEVDPDELNAARAAKNEQRASRNDRAAKGRSQPSRRPGRTIEPPSWRRVWKRALLIGPVVVIAMILLNPHVPVPQRIVPAVVMLAFFLPFSYFTDSLAYRMYRKRMDRVARAGKS